MPVQKYRDVSEMPRPPLAEPHELARRIRACWDRAFVLAPPRFPRGVQKFRSLEEANRAREELRRGRAAELQP